MLPRRNILIFHQAALGDFITTWPLALALGRVFAQSRVMYVTGADKGRLAEDVLGVEWRSADDGWHGLHGDGGVPDAVARTLRATQCVVLFSESDEPTFVGNLVQFVGDVPLIHLRPKPPAGTHVLEHHLQQLAGQGKLAGYVQQMQTLLRTNGLARNRPPGGGVVIHPGSGSAAKNWPIESFVAVAENLVARGKSVRFVLGEVELERWPPADVQRLTAVADVVKPDGLAGLRKTLAESAAYVGNDSGPAHLAAALGVPTVALFGPASDAAAWSPTGPHVTVLPFDTPTAAVAAAALKT